MTTMMLTPLEAWVAFKMGLPAGQRPDSERLAAYQLHRLNQTLTKVAQCNLFYRELFEDRKTGCLTRLDELGDLPFTTAESLRQAPMQHLCISQGDVARVVTLHTSGTTGDPKRVYFSDADLERTLDFFQHGLMTMVRSGQRVLILLPGGLPDSAANLLQAAAARMDVEAVIHGLVQDPADTIQAILDFETHCLVGIPVQVLSLVRHPDAARIPVGMIQSILLSTDYVPRAVVAAIQKVWSCGVFQHYGMTEMGYGGAMSCAAHDGYHLREADLLFELIDPVTLQPAPDGCPGEVVFTTLNHQAMPLIRYRTGDLAAFITEPCPCGSVLRRMQWVRGRREEKISLKDGIVFDLADLDEVLFALPGVVNFSVTLRSSSDGDHLQVTLFADQSDGLDPIDAAGSIIKVSALRKAEAGGVLVLDPIVIEQGIGASGPVVKRKIVDKRKP